MMKMFMKMFNIFPITILENLYVPFETLKRNLATVLRVYPSFKKPQKGTLRKIQGKSAKCWASGKEFKVGDIVLKIENCFLVLYGSNKAICKYDL